MKREINNVRPKTSPGKVLPGMDLDRQGPLVSRRKSTLNRAKISPVRHRTVGLQTPIIKNPKIKMHNVISKHGISSLRKLGSQAKTIQHEPIKLAGVILLILVMLPFAFKLFSGKKPARTAVEGTQTAATDIDPIVPANVPSVAESVKKDTERGTASYQDSYLGAKLTVTQQNLPPDFATSAEKLQQVGASIGATESFITKNYGTVYMGTAEGENAVGQRLVFMTPKLLVFITAASKFSATQWTQYIEGLN